MTEHRPQTSLGLAWTNASTRGLEDELDCAVRTSAAVMITGENGVGKQFLAHLIHERSLNRGPLTVADGGDARLPAVSEGTLLIEHIDKVPMAMQGELLDSMEILLARGSQVRLMSSTSVDLLPQLRAQEFRPELFYRLNVIHLCIPPLRDRRDEIPMLLRHQLAALGSEAQTFVSTVAWQRLVDYSWPGNVDELKAVTEQLVNASDLSDDVKLKLQAYVSGCYGSLTSFNVLFADEDEEFKGNGGE